MPPSAVGNASSVTSSALVAALRRRVFIPRGCCCALADAPLRLEEPFALFSVSSSFAVTEESSAVDEGAETVALSAALADVASAIAADNARSKLAKTDLGTDSSNPRASNSRLSILSPAAPFPRSLNMRWRVNAPRRSTRAPSWKREDQMASSERRR